MQKFSHMKIGTHRPSLVRSLIQLPRLAYRLYRWRGLSGGWLPRYWREHRRFERHTFSPSQPIDVMVLFSDHFEPARRHGDAAAIESVRSWCAAYEELAGPHRDSDGRPPQHTWFYRYDYPNPGCVQLLSESTFRGFGEVEFHLHHGHDTEETFRQTFRDGLEWFNRFGAMLTAEPSPRQRFGYVAGNSALDNGAGDDTLSGCDTELRVLRDMGCYADFTFPALGSPAQPCITNAIYYAAEDGCSKSYNRGSPVVVDGTPSGDLMIFQGPVVFDWEHGRLEDGSLENTSPPHPRRVPHWLSAHVHVPGRPEWVFVKLHTHAMQNRVSFLSDATDQMFRAMEEMWSRPPFRLHYVTAREVYNIVKAAEAGHSGNPNDYRDFDVPRPANRVVCCDRPYRLLSYSPKRIEIELLEPGQACIELAEGPVQRIAGRLRRVEVLIQDGDPDLRLDGEGPFEVISRAEAPTLAATTQGR
jgi:hypothetical protein